MARLARIVVPECPRHVTARGNRREPIFFEEGDQEIYCDVLAEQVRRAGVQVWAYCLMPNHVHLILYPSTEDGLGRALGGAHRRWANYVNVRGRWRGHLFDGRFASVAMDERHLLAAVRSHQIEQVPAQVKASATQVTLPTRLEKLRRKLTIIFFHIASRTSPSAFTLTPFL